MQKNHCQMASSKALVKPTPSAFFGYKCIDSFLHRTLSLTFVAPDWRANSRLFLNTMSVGMLRMLYLALNADSTSVFDLPRRTSGSNNFATCAKMRHCSFLRHPSCRIFFNPLYSKVASIYVYFFNRLKSISTAIPLVGE